MGKIAQSTMVSPRVATVATAASNDSPALVSAKAEYLMEVIQRLSLTRTLDEVTTIVRHAARELVDADGATFVLRDEGFCHYVDEEAISPLWKGKKFPMETCVSGWAMLNNDTAVIEDIYNDPRVPVSAYEPTFVRSLVMTPIRGENPIGAIGTYWAVKRTASAEEQKLLRVLANSTSIALENVRIVGDLKKSNEALSDSIRSRDEFLSIAAHELRTPLSALKLQLQMTEQDLGGEINPVEIREDMQMALRQTVKLGHLIEQLLDISRIRLEKLDLNQTDFSLSELTKHVLDISSHGIKEVGCEIKFSAPSDPVVGHWDRLRVEQVVSNLISNACKYASGKLVEVGVSRDDHNAYLSVKDHGPGIAKEDRERIFERFVRATSVNHVSGLGLGLSIVKSIVTAHSGEIEVISEPGKGAEFVVRLPLDPFLKKEVVHV